MLNEADGMLDMMAGGNLWEGVMREVVRYSGGDYMMDDEKSPRN